MPWSLVSQPLLMMKGTQTMSEAVTKVDPYSDEVLLTVPKGADVNFDVSWWYVATDGTEVMEPLVATQGYASDVYDGDVIISFDTADGYVTISAGVALVRVPGDDTALMDNLERGVWELIGITATGEKKKLCYGPVTIREDV